MNIRKALEENMERIFAETRNKRKKKSFKRLVNHLRVYTKAIKKNCEIKELNAICATIFNAKCFRQKYNVCKRVTENAYRVGIENKKKDQQPKGNFLSLAIFSLRIFISQCVKSIAAFIIVFKNIQPVNLKWKKNKDQQTKKKAKSMQWKARKKRKIYSR